VTDRLTATREFWDGLTGEEGEFARQAEYGSAMWAAEPNWGDWSVPESQLRLLPDVAGLDTIELGCGTAYFSGWLARAGARPVALDASARQLELARGLQERHGVGFPLVLADAEQVPYPDRSFDLALSEYGASSWCDPERWVPEAARLLRPGGLLIFLTVSPLLTLCGAGDRPGRRPAAPAVLRDARGGDARLRDHRVPAAVRRLGPGAARRRPGGGAAGGDPGAGGGDVAVAVRGRGVGAPVAVGVRVGGPQGGRTAERGQRAVGAQPCFITVC
jgi:SAM-dependent methyltransferase